MPNVSTSKKLQDHIVRLGEEKLTSLATIGIKDFYESKLDAAFIELQQMADKGISPDIIAGKAMRFLRKMQGLSLQDIATKAGCTRQMISYIENGQKGPSVDSLLAIAKALRVPHSALIFEPIETGAGSASSWIGRRRALDRDEIVSNWIRKR